MYIYILLILNGGDYIHVGPHCSREKEHHQISRAYDLLLSDDPDSKITIFPRSLRLR